MSDDKDDENLPLAAVTIQQLINMAEYLLEMGSGDQVIGLEVVRAPDGSHCVLQFRLHSGPELLELSTIRRIPHPFDPPELENWDNLLNEMGRNRERSGGEEEEEEEEEETEEDDELEEEMMEDD